MDNDSQEVEEKEEVNIQDVNIDGSADIQFEDVLDIDKIHEQLKGDLPVEPDSDSLAQVDKLLESAIVASPIVQQPPIVNNDSNNVKKYVIYVESDNVDYMENLSADERKKIINRVLRDQNQLSEQEKLARKRRNFVSHVILAVLTFLICFPILFIFVNKATKISIENYNNAKKNFSQLYKEQGKIKMK